MKLSGPTLDIHGDKNTQINAENVAYYADFSNREEFDQGVISSIFEFVIDRKNKENSDGKSRPEKLINIAKKIQRNFKASGDRDEINEYCRRAFDKIALIEKVFSGLDSDEQDDVHSYIFSRYLENKKSNVSNIDNFDILYKHFIPPHKKADPTYENIAKSFVLFFFMDCTIFEKTKDERSQMKMDL